MNSNNFTIRFVVVDDDPDQLRYVEQNLKIAFGIRKSAMAVVGRFRDIEDYLNFLLEGQVAFDVLVTDIFWPKVGMSDKQAKQGFQAIVYTSTHRPRTLIVALTGGDNETRNIASQAYDVGAHIFKFHDDDIPGDRGQGWIDLVDEIQVLLESGPPFEMPRTPRVRPAGQGRTPADAAELIELICRRFPLYVTQLRQRHGGRATLEVSDEYDVQDALHALLRVHFEDVRDEDPVRSHGSGSSRVDLVIRDRRVVIEVKMTRETLTGKKLVDQIAIDKERYRAVPELDELIFYVYDPELRLNNIAAGIERDLTEQASDMNVRVIISPNLSSTSNPSREE